MISQILEKISTEEYIKNQYIGLDERIAKFNEEAEYLLSVNGVTSTNLNEDIIDDITAKIAKIKDIFELNKIYSYLFKDTIKQKVSDILTAKGIKSKYDVALVTTWIIEANATVKDKMDFLKQISPGATKPIIEIDKSNVGSFVTPSDIKNLIINDHVVLETFINDALKWIPAGASGAATGPFEGFILLLSANNVPITKGDLKLGKISFEVKANNVNKKGSSTGGGAMCGGKGNKNWKAIDIEKVIQKKYPNARLQNVDYRITSTNTKNIWDLAESIDHNNANGVFLGIIKIILSAYYITPTDARTKFSKRISKITTNRKKCFEDIKFYFFAYSYEYYKEIEGWDYMIIANQHSQKFCIINDYKDLKTSFDYFYLGFADFKFDNAPTSIRIGLKV